jgi:hypothetical protein
MEGMERLFAVRLMDGGVLFSSSSPGRKLSCEALGYLLLLLTLVEAFARPVSHWEAILCCAPKALQHWCC